MWVVDFDIPADKWLVQCSELPGCEVKVVDPFPNGDDKTVMRVQVRSEFLSPVVIFAMKHGYDLGVHPPRLEA